MTVSACVVCGCPVEDGLCRHHVDGYTGDRWADTNRILCDWLHRGIEPTRLTAEQRADEWAPLDSGVC